MQIGTPRPTAGAGRDDEHDRMRLVVLHAQKYANPRSVNVRAGHAGVQNARLSPQQDSCCQDTIFAAPALVDGLRASARAVVDVRRQRGRETARHSQPLCPRASRREPGVTHQQEFASNVEWWVKRPRAAGQRRSSSALPRREPRNGVWAAPVLCERRHRGDRCKVTCKMRRLTKSAKSDALISPPCVYYITEFPYEVLCQCRSHEHREPDPLELDLAPC